MQQPAVFKGTEHCLLFVMGIKFMHRPASANRATWPFVWPSYQGQTFMHSYTLIFSLHNWKVEGKWSITTGRRDSLQHIHTHTHSHTHWFIQCFSCYCGSKKAVPVCPQAICQRLHTALHSSLGKCPFAMEREHETCCQE